MVMQNNGQNFRLVSLLFETFLFALTIAALGRRRTGELPNRSIINLFVRDGTWAFIIIFGELLASRSTGVWLMRCAYSGVGSKRDHKCIG